MSDHWDDYFNQEKAPPDFLVERVDVVGERALADQLAKLADLYIAKQQGNRIAGLADLGEDLLKLAETGIRDDSSSCAGLRRNCAAEPAEESLVISHAMPITTFIGISLVPQLATA
ncbi:hypothetical protein [Aeromonas veronii]|uniref:hypothetical protein n=1 Tax=Aeromonas veronii TaxID=654 RepID=UPI001BD11E10|nr:hypothetical protein [Aeromonas veronii]MBS4724436.1 hypothetical protein [Aeromonas veronii]